MRHRLGVFLFFLILIFSIAYAQESGNSFNIDGMTLEEKAYQVMMVNIPSSANIASYIKKEFEKGVPGSILLFKQNFYDTCEKSVAYINEVKSAFASLSREKGFKGVSPLIAVDNEGGSVFRTSAITSILPSARSMAKNLKTEEMEELISLVAKQMKMLGIDFNLAPVAECATKENELLLGQRTFSTSSQITIDYANAFIRGMNSEGILCSIKHFPGNGGDDPHGGTSKLMCSKQEFEQLYLHTFKKIVEEKHVAISLLLSHVTFSIVEDVPFCLSKKGIKEIIRKKMGFSSLVLTDDIAMGALKKRGSSSDNAILALKAGADMVMCSERRITDIIKTIVNEAKKDKAFASRLDEAVLNVLKTKEILFEIDSKNSFKFNINHFNEAKEKADMIIKKAF